MTKIDLKSRPAAGVELIDLRHVDEPFERAVLNGLQRRNKAIPPRFLYDARGSALFDRICTLPEYYPTRTETAILTAHAGAIADWVGPRAALVELGSGSSTKTRIVLDALKEPSAYVPVDISREHLRNAAEAIAADYPDLDVIAICGDYAADFPLPRTGARNVGFFPGSTIGNLDADQARDLLRAWRSRLGADGGMILGADMRKSDAVLEAAYNDSQGVTEAFIKNILVRINSELGGDIDPSAFAYEANYAPRPGRVEMRLRSRRRQKLHIAGETITLAENEAIHVENSHKYTPEQLEALAADTGFAIDQSFSDARGWFSVQLWRAA